MSEKDGFAQRKVAMEEEYFRKKEQELVEKMRYRTAKDAERDKLAESIGVADEAILATLQELGYTRDTVRLLHLVPLVQVAWASGSVTPREREMVLRLCEWRGVGKGRYGLGAVEQMAQRAPVGRVFPDDSADHLLLA